MFATHKLTHQIRFAETDASGFAYFDSYIRLMEETEYSFLRSRGLSVVVRDERGTIGFPRLNCHLQIERPVRFGDIVEVRLQLSSIDGKQILYDFQIFDDQDDLIAQGRYCVACCRFPSVGLPFAILTPDFIHDRLTATRTDLIP